MRETFVFALIFSGTLIAAPKNLEVVSGQAAMSKVSENQHLITASDKAILEWGDFSIDPKEWVQFVFPKDGCCALNRVISSLPSNLLGTLQSNGSIYLINPNGVLMGNESVINTASFLASTLDICNGDFLSSEDQCFTGSSIAKIVQLGSITAQSGDIILLGRIIEQKGELKASQGDALLGIGREIWLKPSGSDRLFIQMQPFEEEKIETGLSCEGRIEALNAELKAEGNPYVYAIKQTGSIDAKGIFKQGGEVFLVAEEGIVASDGKITGTAIEIHGERVVVDGELRAAEGGTILVGGDAQFAYVGPSAKIVAESGKVTVLADQRTDFFGAISVRGGDEGGDGGFVEVSGGYLNYQGLADCTAPKGRTGTILLDPIAIAIQTPDTAVSITGINPIIIQPSASPSLISPATLTTQLGLGNVLIQPSTAGIGGSGDIFVNEMVVYASANSLTLSNQNLTAVGGTGVIAVAPGITLQNTGAGSITFVSVDTILVQGQVLAASGDLSFTAPNGIFIGGMPNNMPGPGGIIGSALGTLTLETDIGDIIVRGGSGAGDPSAITIASGRADIHSGRDIIIQGDGSAAPASASIESALSGGLFITADRNLLMQGGANGASAGILVNSGSCSITVGQNASLLAGSNTSDAAILGATTGSISMNVGQDLFLIAGASSFAGIASIQGAIRVVVGGNINSIGDLSAASLFLVGLGHRSISVRAEGNILLDATFVSNTGTGEILFSAGRDLTIQNLSLISSNSGVINLVCDALFPTSPGIGSGSFSIDSTAQVTSFAPATQVAPIRIFTARRSQNTIDGFLNGSTFSAGPIFMNSSTERWGVYFNNSFGGLPYTVFYKETPFTIPPDLGFLSKFTRATAESLQEWQQDFYSLVFSPVSFSVKYPDMKDINITLMRRAYRTYNMKKLDPL